MMKVEYLLKVKDYSAFSHMTYQDNIKSLLKCSFGIASLFFFAFRLIVINLSNNL